MLQKRIVIIAGIVTILSVIGLGVFSGVQKKPNLILEIAPSAASITVDGKKINKTSLFVTPGKHSLVASLNGFANNEQVFVAETGKVISLIVLLDPNSATGEKYLRDNPKEQFSREALGGKLSARLSGNTSAKNPILKSLPFIDRLYRVDYGASVKNRSDPLAVALFVTFYSEQGKQDAIDWLQFEGVNTATAEILYINGSDAAAEKI